MKTRLRILSVCVVFAAIGAIVFWKKSAPPAAVKNPPRSIVTEPVSAPIQVEDIRAPHVVHQPFADEPSLAKRLEKKKRRAPAQVRKGLVIAPGVYVAENVYAVSSKDYRPSMGKVIFSSKSMMFVESPSRITDGANVVYDKARDKYYPVSAVLKIPDAEKIREKLLADGHQEYYYHRQLKILYLQSSHEQVLTLYQELRAEGLNVSLEIIRADLRSR